MDSAHWKSCHGARSAWWTAKRSFFVTTIVTGLPATVCANVATGAITFEQQEAAAFDEEAVEAKMREQAPLRNPRRKKNIIMALTTPMGIISIPTVTMRIPAVVPDQAWLLRRRISTQNRISADDSRVQQYSIPEKEYFRASPMAGSD